MVSRNQKLLDRLERKLIQQETLSHRQAWALYEALHREAVALGVISSKNMLEGLDVDLRIAKAIHGFDA